MYSEQVRDHYEDPRNAGAVDNPSGKAIVRSPVDSDTVLITLRIEDGLIADARFKCMGCAVAIACSSVATEMARGKSVEQAYEITKHSVALVARNAQNLSIATLSKSGFGQIRVLAAGRSSVIEARAA